MNLQVTTHPDSEISALIVHGLNNHANVMDDIEEYLHTHKANTCKVALTGHREDIDAFKNVEFEHWVEDIKAGYDHLESLKKPILLIGFSLGALVGVTSQMREKNIQFSGMLLFAPALKTRWYTWPMRLTSFLGRHRMIPSSAPKEYRANKATSAAAYEELFKGVKYFNETSLKKSKHLSVPTEVFIDPMDELVSHVGLRAMVRDLKLKKHWRINKIKSKSQYSHLIIDKPSLGSHQWKQVEEKIEKLIQATSNEY